MNDQRKTKAQLVEELEGLRRRVSVLEGSENQSVATVDTRKKIDIYLRSLIEMSSGAMFCYGFDNPIPIDLPIEEQVKLMYKCTLVNCNKACAFSYGYEEPDDVIGKSFSELFKAVPESVDKLFYSTIENGYSIKDGEGSSKQPDGSIRYFLNNAFGVVENGKLICMWGSFTDVTERKQTEQALRESEEKYRSIFEGANDAILHVDKNMTVLDVNPAFTEITFILKDAIVGKSAFELAKKFVSVKQLPKILNILKRIFTKTLLQ